MADLNPAALLTASQGAKYAGVTLAAFCNWVTIGKLAPAMRDGRVLKDSKGRPLYRLLAIAKAEADDRRTLRRRPVAA